MFAESNQQRQRQHQTQHKDLFSVNENSASCKEKITDVQNNKNIIPTTSMRAAGLSMTSKNSMSSFSLSSTASTPSEDTRPDPLLSATKNESSSPPASELNTIESEKLDDFLDHFLAGGAENVDTIPLNLEDYSFSSGDVSLNNLVHDADDDQHLRLMGM